VRRSLHHAATVECKRVDPALARWGFARREERRSNLALDGYVLEVLGEPPVAKAYEIDPAGDPIVHVGLDLRTNDKGNSIGKSLDDTVAQALRAAGGLAERWAEFATHQPNRPTFIVPVIVTTASLEWVPTALEEADLSTGDLPTNEVLQAQWLWLSVNVSASLSPRVTRPPHRRGIRPLLLNKHRRAVVIANVAGLRPALRAVARIEPTPLS
jgi:hypothetical protein